MSNLYQDAILDAKALRASAMANAKAALEEAFEPKIQEMISKHLSEEEEMEEAKDHEMEEGYNEEGKMPHEEGADINEQELEEILGQLEELEKTPTEESLNEAEEEEEEEKEEEEGEEEAEEAAEGEEEVTDDTKIIDITLGDLKQVIQSLMPGQEMPAAEEEPTADSEAEAEVSLEEILDELANEGMEEEGMETSGHYDAENVNPATVPAGSQVEEGFADIPAEAYDAILKGIQDLANTNADGAKNMFNALATMGSGGAVIAALRKMFPGVKKTMDKTSSVGSAPKGLTKFEAKELKEAKATIQTLRKDLQEVNLLNAKYLYMNKIFKGKSLTESQKLKVINALDRATSVKEVKNAYETIRESFESKKGQLKESIGFASKPAGVAPKANIVESEQFVSRWQKLAGIK